MSLQTTSIGVVDLARSGLTPIVNRSRGWTGLPAWSPDGKRLAFSDDKKGTPDLPVGGADGRDLEPLYQSSDPFKHVMNWSPDGKVIVLDDRKVEPFLRSPAQDSFAAVSPDGGWMAYVSEVAGRPETFVQACPDPGESHRLTTEGTHAGLQRMLAIVPEAGNSARSITVLKN